MATTTTAAGATPTYMSFPIAKWEKTPDGDVMVWGKATDGSIDSDEQIVDPAWAGKAIQDWLKSGGNLRVQHNAQRDPAGVGMEVEDDGDGGQWVKGLVVEPVAKTLVEKGALRAYSVGIARPQIVRDQTARGGRIVGGELVEISLVDRPANKNCTLALVKAAKDGTPEWVGELDGDPGLLTKAAAATVPAPAVVPDEPGQAGTDMTVNLPGGVQVSFSPADMARLVNKGRGGTATAEPDTGKRDMDPNVGGGVDRDKISADDFAGRDRSFPIVKPADVSDAATSIGRAGPDNYSADQLRDNIIRIARRKGPQFVAELPDAWTHANASKAAPPTDTDDTDTDTDGDGDGDGDAGTDSPSDDAKNDDAKNDDAKNGSGKKLPPWLKPGGKKKKAKAARKALRAALTATAPPTAPAAPAAEVVKSDDVSCTGCGKGLDDDHKFCPTCGKKVPAAAAKADEPAATKAKGKKGKPTPADGVTGQHTDPVPAHREPDGPAIEAFEHDAGLPTVPDSDMEMKAALRLKSLGVPQEMGALHDLTCPAYHPQLAAKAHPRFTLAGLDVDAWQQKALDAAVRAPLDVAQASSRLWQHATTLKAADPVDLDELRAEAHKAFSDANPGPGTAPTPGELSPARFRRPYLTGGHAAPSTGQDGPNTAAIPSSGGITAADYNRGPLTGGHAADSPANKDDRQRPIEAPAVTGRPIRTYYTNVGKDNARQAMAAMHDHIAQTFPDLCPMTGLASPEMQSRPVPTPGNTPPVAAVKAAKKARKALRRELAEKVAASEMTLDKARELLGVAPVAKTTEPAAEPAAQPEAAAGSPAGPAEPVEVAKAAGAAPDVAALVKAAVAEATAELTTTTAGLAAELAATRKLARKQAKLIDRLADQPDTTGAPYRGAAIHHTLQTVAAPVGPDTVAKAAEQSQALVLRELEQEWRTNPDPAQREAAWSVICKMRGIPNRT